MYQQTKKLVSSIYIWSYFIIIDFLNHLSCLKGYYKKVKKTLKLIFYNWQLNETSKTPQKKNPLKLVRKFLLANYG